jgi:hypothetical protein
MRMCEHMYVHIRITSNNVLNHTVSHRVQYLISLNQRSENRFVEVYLYTYSLSYTFSFCSEKHDKLHVVN